MHSALTTNAAKIALAFCILIAARVSADDDADKKFRDMFPGLSPGPVDYEVLYTLPDIYEFMDAETPQHVYDSIIRHHHLTAEAASKLVVQTLMARDGMYLVVYLVRWRDEGYDSDTAKLHAEIIDQNCEVMADEFPDFCTQHNRHRRGAYAVVDEEDGVLGVLPHFFRADNAIPPVLPDDIMYPGSLESFSRPYISFELFSTSISKYTFGLPEGESRACLRGKFGMADFDGDGVLDLVLVYGDITDDQYAHQVEPKVVALTRVHFSIIRLDRNGSRVLMTDELFSYEMDYTKFYESGAGQGIYRDSKFYWGDYDADGVSDYLVRRRQGPLTFTYRTDDDRYIAAPYTDSAILYLGRKDGSYVRFAPDDEQAFNAFIASTTDWNDGFPDHALCR